MNTILMAASTQTILQPVNTILLLFAAALGVVGVFDIITGIFMVRNALLEQDPNQQSRGMTKVIAGVICAAVTVILGLMGFTI